MSILAHSTGTATAPSPTEQCPTGTVLVDGVQVAIAETATGAQLTASQVCSLPMDTLLTKVDAELDTTNITAHGFFGYVTITKAGHVTVYTPVDMDDDARDAAIRFLITQHLGLPTHHFPQGMTVTRLTLPTQGRQA